MKTHYAIAEKRAAVGSLISRDNYRLWLRASGETTPAEDEAAVFGTRAEAAEFAEAAGIELGKTSWWKIERV